MIAYILKSSLNLLLLFGLYWFLLRREKLFIFIRYFLLFSIIISLVLPFISIPVNIETNEAKGNLITLLNGSLPALNYKQNPISDISTQQYIDAESFTEAVPVRISFSRILLIVYLLGLILSLFRFTKNIFNIYRQIKLSESINFSGRKLVLIDNQINPYCFFNTIFVCKHDYLNNKIAKEFLAHELEHIRQSHSTDIILIELIRIVYWFNPILYLYNRAIRVNHEYLADGGVLRDSPDIENYVDKLLSLISYRETIPITSGLNHSLMKRRLLMITKPRSKSINSGLRITLALCMILVFFLFLSFKPSNTQPFVSLTNQKADTDTLLIDDDPSISNMPLNLTQQSFNIIDKKVTYTASGYIKQDTINKTVLLVDNALVRYGEISIKADSIVINMITNQLYASGRFNKSRGIIGRTILNEGSQEIEADELTYNLVTHRATAKNIKAGVSLAPKNSDSLVSTIEPKQKGDEGLVFQVGSEKPELFPIRKGEYSEMSRNFGDKNVHPVTKEERFHYGIDIEAKFGIDVMATAGGKVIKAGWEDKSYGNLILIDHGNGYQSLYAHLKDFNVNNGDSIVKGQIIGHVGSSGTSTYPHLHFEIRSKGDRVNPLNYLK